jgi:transcriptional regulator with XRE-family HTH domain
MARAIRASRASQYETPAYREIIARVAANVRRLREATGLSQEAVAEKCDMPPRSLQMVESAQTNVTATTLARLCVGFGVDVVALLAPAAPMAKRKAGRPKKAPAAG